MAPHSAHAAPTILPAAQVETAEEPQVTLTPEEPASEEPVPEEEPEAAEPVMPPTEEQAAKRAAQLERLAALPEHLRLGVTLPGMRKLLSELPPDALEQVNLHNAKYPPNDSENGYCNQYFITKWAKEAKEGQPEGDGLAVCERLQKQGSPHVGEATVFVSWYLNTPITTLLDALANFLEQQGLREEDTYFWVCDYVIRQTDVKTDLAWLGECVSAVGHTVLLMEPWHAPAPLKRAYCIKEVLHAEERLAVRRGDVLGAAGRVRSGTRP